MDKKSRVPRSPAKKNVLPKKIQNEVKEIVANGLTDAILGFQPGGIGAQLSQVTTIFRNLRWYLVSNMRQPLSQAYVELGIIQTVVNVPVDDAMRGGIEIKSKELSPDEIEKLQYTMEQENDINKMAQTLKWDRLFGGAGLLIITGQDWETPLEMSSLQPGDPLDFRAVDMWELFWDHQNVEGDGEPIDNPQVEFYSYYGKKIHKSRVLITRGIEAPSFIKPRLRGWGVSVVEILVRSINQYLKANDLTFEILDEFKIDVYKIKNLTNTLLTPGGTQKIQQRVQLANQQKNYQSAVTMDSEDDYIQKELSFAGIAETMIGIRMQVASDLRMPLTKVFGISAAGFSSGEDDIENYNAMVESTVRSKSKFHLINMVKLRCQSLFGYVPEDLQIGFKPLRVLSSEQEENVKSQKFNRILAARQAGEITSMEFRDACNKDQLLGISLDTSDQFIPEQTLKVEGNEVKASPQKVSTIEAKETPEAKT